MKTVNFKTLGCRLNISESDALALGFRKLGYEIVPFDQKADVSIVNTCTVTDKADGKNRYYIRKAVRDHGKFVVVTGCYAQTDRSEVAEIPGVGLIVDNRWKGRIPQLVERALQSANNPRGENPAATAIEDSASESAQPEARVYNFGLSLPSGRTRAFLKVQDGCNKSCAYCKIPSARGRAISAPPELIKKHYADMNAAGVKEIVLSGINLGWYRYNPNENVKSLPRLLSDLFALELSPRIRISSIEPGDITASLLSVTAGHPKFTPFYHVPVQAGSDRILKLMRRGYRREHFVKRIELIREYHQRAGGERTEPFISTDIIVGYPGETEEEFEQSVALVEELELAGVHVFPFSPRRGTGVMTAAAAGDFHPKEVIGRRAARLKETAARLEKAYIRKMAGRRQTGIFQPGKPGYFLTDSNLKVVIPNIAHVHHGKSASSSDNFHGETNMAAGGLCFREFPAGSVSSLEIGDLMLVGAKNMAAGRVIASA